MEVKSRKNMEQAGLAEDSIVLSFTGAAGHSFGAFIPKGMSML